MEPAGRGAQIRLDYLISRTAASGRLPGIAHASTLTSSEAAVVSGSERLRRVSRCSHGTGITPRCPHGEPWPSVCMTPRSGLPLPRQGRSFVPHQGDH
jgi:hypothetical protein